MDKSLFQIEQEYLLLNEQIMNSEGVLDEQTEQALMINQQELERKGQGYGFVILKNRSEIDIIDMEIKRLQGHKKAREAANQRLEGALNSAMALYQVDEITGPALRISFRKSTSTDIVDMEKIPAEYIKTEVTRSAKKTEIKDAILAGKEVPGAELKYNKNLVVK